MSAHHNVATLFKYQRWDETTVQLLAQPLRNGLLSGTLNHLLDPACEVVQLVCYSELIRVSDFP